MNIAVRTSPSWTLLGALASTQRAVVDDAGVVLLRGGQLEVQWAVGAEDRWYRATEEGALRQRLLGDAPVVETRVRIPGGDVAHRAYVARPAGGGAPVLVLEMHNQTPVPVAVALGVAAGVAEHSAIESVALDGATLLIDGVPLLRAAKPPSRASACVATDALAEAIDGFAGEELAATSDAQGRCSAALVYPLPHTATLRVVVSLDAIAHDASGGGAIGALPTPDELPSAEQVAKGWEAQRNRAMTMRLPDARLQAAADAARCTLLVLHDGPDIRDDLGELVDPVAESLVLVALARTGFTTEATEVLRGLEHRLGADGWFDRSRHQDTNGALLWALHELFIATGDVNLIGRLAPQIGAAVAGIDRRRRSRRRRGGAPSGLLPSGSAPAWLGGDGVRFVNDLWSLAGFRAAAALLTVVGEQGAADAARQAAVEHAVTLREAMEVTARDAIPSIGSGQEPDAHVVTLLVGSLLGTLDDDVAKAVARWAHGVRGDAVGLPAQPAEFGGDGVINVRTSLLLALHDARNNEARGQDALVRLVGAAPHVLSLPDVLDVAARRGAGTHGHDPVATALLVLACHALLVRDEPGSLDLAPVAPATWWGQRWEVLGAPTSHGLVSSAVRWRDDRPVLMWEIEPREDAPPVIVHASGLAPQWSSHELAGEVVFDAIPRPGGEVQEKRRRRIAVAMGTVGVADDTTSSDARPLAATPGASADVDDVDRDPARDARIDPAP